MAGPHGLGDAPQALVAESVLREVLYHRVEQHAARRLSARRVDPSGMYQMVQSLRMAGQHDEPARSSIRTGRRSVTRRQAWPSR